MNIYKESSECAPRGDKYRSWPIDGQVEQVNLDKCKWHETSVRNDLRAEIQKKFDEVRNGSYLHGKLDQWNQKDLVYRNADHACRLRLRYGHILANKQRKRAENEKGEDKKEPDWVTFEFSFRDVDYLFGPRGWMYGDYHMSLGAATEVSKSVLRHDQVELMLILARILGPAFEGFQNRVADSQDHYHVQYLQQVTTIWHADNLDRFPATATLMRDGDPKKLARSVMEVWKRIQCPSAKEKAGVGVEVNVEFDLLVRSNGEDTEEVLLLPREGRPRRKEGEEEKESPKKRPRVVTLLDSRFEQNSKDHMGNFGALEMAGYLGKLGSKEAFDIVSQKNCTSYADAIKELTFPREKWSSLLDDLSIH